MESYSPLLGGERKREMGEQRSQPSLGGGLSVFMREDGLSFGFGPGSAGTWVCGSTFLFSLLCKSFWW